MGKTNDSAQAVSDIINTGINSIAVDALYGIIVGYVPFLGWPVISLVTKAIINYFAGFIFRYLNKVGINLVIDIQTSAEQNAYSEAEGKLHDANLSGNPDEIKKASEEFDKMARSLILWDGVVS